MNRILLVNPISSAKYLSDSFKVSGIYSIAIYTNIDELDEWTKPAASLFDEQFHFNSFSLTDIYPHIAHLQVDYVLNGGDQTVDLCDQLAHKFACKFENSLATSEIRQNKFLQQQALFKHNLPAVKQVKMPLNNLDLAVLKKLDYPLFAKPVNGIASLGAFMASSYNELIAILDKQPRKVYLQTVNEYMFQEYLSGEEIFIDSFSLDGEHFISGVYRYFKENQNGTPVYRYIEVVNEAEKILPAIKFVKNALDATDLSNGFAHTELFVTSHGERLVEINPRISGCAGLVNQLGCLTGLIPQDKYLIDSCFKAQPVDPDIVFPKRYGRLIFLYNHENIDCRHIKSFNSKTIMSNIPVNHNEIISLLDVKQFILLVSDDLNQLNADSQYLIKNDVL